jgi:transposase-like protein
MPTQEDFQRDLSDRCREAVRATIQVVLDEELERLIGAGPYERTVERVDMRNGHYPRRVVTTSGEVDVRVGRSRSGGSATAPLGRYARRRPEIDDAITQAYVRGLSTRDMAGVTTALVGKRVGRSTVSRVIGVNYFCRLTTTILAGPTGGSRGVDLGGVVVVAG